MSVLELIKEFDLAIDDREDTGKATRVLEQLANVQPETTNEAVSLLALAAQTTEGETCDHDASESDRATAHGLVSNVVRFFAKQGASSLLPRDMQGQFRDVFE